MPFLGDSHRMDSEKYQAYVKTRLQRSHAGLSRQGLVGLALATALGVAGLAVEYPTAGRPIARAYSEFVARTQAPTPTPVH